MRSMMFAALLALIAPVAARAAGSGCQDTSGSLVLEKVRTGASGSEIFGCINRSLEKISTGTAVAQSTYSAYTFGKINVSTIGANGAPLYLSSATTLGAGLFFKLEPTSYLVNYGSASVQGANGLGVTYGVTAGSATVQNNLTVIGTATVQGNAFSVGGSTFAVSASSVGIGTASPGAKLHLSSGTLLVDGLSGNIRVPGSSVTASAFFGDGSHLTGLTTGGDMFLANNNPMTGANTSAGSLTMLSGSTFYVSPGSYGSIASGVEISSNGYIVINSSSPSNKTAFPIETMWVRWFSATASSGCVAIVQAESSDPSAPFVGTSTNATTSNFGTGSSAAVLLRNSAGQHLCNPGDQCLMGLRGRFQVQADASGLTSSQDIATSATRCRAAALNSNSDGNVWGWRFSRDAVLANTVFWATPYR